jgi:4-hydroxybenzoate polyprenyltransferase
LLSPPVAATALEVAAPIPLVVDLDGTLIHTDLLHESAVALFRAAPLRALLIPFWLRRGKAALKQQLAQHTRIDASLLPYNQELLAWLRQQREAGRSLILCTATDLKLAQAVASDCALFDEVMASDGALNLDGRNKADALVKRFGKGGFDYVGNSHVDLAVWQQARRAVVVNPGLTLASRAGTCCEVVKVFESPARGLSTWGRALRVHHWLKNALVLVPLFAAHQLADASLDLLWAFIAFSLCASSVYLVNDLMDLENDRQHPRKRSRPFASSALPLWTGVVLAPVLALGGFLFASLLGTVFVYWLGVYFVLTWAYSMWLKRIVLLDCLALALLYTLRIVAGGEAARLAPSFWLLAFSAFLFLSLSFVKRYAELMVHQTAGNDQLKGRGYCTSDAPVILALGVASGYTAVVVLALYLNSDAVLRLYRSPGLVWATVPILVYWLSWMWLRAARGEMHDDPLVFAFKDRNSLAAGALFAASLLFGSTGS